MEQKKHDVITLGTAVVDITAYPADKIIFDRDNTLIEEVRMYPGGDAVNQAMALSGLKDSVSLCCRLGYDSFGRLLKNEAQNAGINTENVVLSRDSVTSTAIVLVAENGERNIICKKGNNYDFCFSDINMDEIADTKALSVASFFCISKLEKYGLEEILKYTKKSGAITFADCGADKKNEGIAAIAPFLPHLDYFMPSEIESTKLTGEENPVKAANILKQYGVNNVVIKLGSSGVYADCGGFCGYVDPFEITPVDTTGAGDSFCAGFIHSVLAGKSTEDSLEFASACGVYTALHFGASSSDITTDKIETIIANTPKHIIY